MNTTRVTIEYIYKGIKRTANVGIVSERGFPVLYWLKFKHGPRYLKKVDGVWQVGGKALDNEVLQALGAALDEQVIKKPSN